MTDPTTATDPQADDGDEKGFWDKLAALIDTRIDEGVERAIKKHARPSASRNGGRSNLPQAIARVMGGPFTPVS